MPKYCESSSATSAACVYGILTGSCVFCFCVSGRHLRLHVHFWLVLFVFFRLTLKDHRIAFFKNMTQKSPSFAKAVCFGSTGIIFFTARPEKRQKMLFVLTIMGVCKT